MEDTVSNHGCGSLLPKIRINREVYPYILKEMDIHEREAFPGTVNM